MDFYIAQVVGTDGDDLTPAGWLDDIHHDLCQFYLEHFGDADGAASPSAMITQHCDTPYGDAAWLVAVAGSPEATEVGRYGLSTVSCRAQDSSNLTVMGYVEATLPTADHTDVLNHINVHVLTPYRRIGVGTALLAVCERIGVEQGRTTSTASSTHRGDDAGYEHLVGPGGASVPRDPAAKFALAHGYQLALVEQEAELPLPVPTHLVDSLFLEARTAACGYTLTHWDDIPEQWIQPMIELRRRFDQDAPHGDLDEEEYLWDEERLLYIQNRRIERQQQVLTVAAVSPNGELAGFTELAAMARSPKTFTQLLTMVDRQHRGRKLALLMKLEALRICSERHPERNRVYTETASYNTRMNAINAQLGFQPKSIYGI